MTQISVCNKLVVILHCRKECKNNFWACAVVVSESELCELIIFAIFVYRNTKKKFKKKQQKTIFAKVETQITNNIT